MVIHLLDSCVKDNFFEKNLLGLGWEQWTELWMPSSCTESNVHSYRYTWMMTKHCLNNTKPQSYVEDIDDIGWSWRTHIISWPCLLGMYSTWMQIERKLDWGMQKDVRIANRNNWEITWVGETSRNSRVVLWFGRTCDKVNSEILWIVKEKDTATAQRLYSMCGRQSVQKKEELETFDELSDVCSQIVSKCKKLDRSGGPDIIWSVNKHARAVIKWTRALWQTLGSFDLLLSSHEWSHTILTCEKPGSALSIGIVPRLSFCRRPWRF